MTTIPDRLDTLSDLSHDIANAMHDLGDEGRKHADQLYRVAKVVSEWAAELRKKEAK